MKNFVPRVLLQEALALSTKQALLIVDLIKLLEKIIDSNEQGYLFMQQLSAEGRSRLLDSARCRKRTIELNKLLRTLP